MTAGGANCKAFRWSRSAPRSFLARRLAVAFVPASVVVLIAMSAAGCAPVEPEQIATPGQAAASAPSRSAASTMPALRHADLATWLDTLDRVHPDAFHAVARATFLDQLEELDRDLDAMSPAQGAVAVMRLAGLLSHERDGHQFALPQLSQDDPVLPLQVYEFDEGVTITAAREPYQDLAGATIVAIGATPIADVLAAIEPLVPRDGPATVPTFRPMFLLRTIVLRGLGVMPDQDGAPVTLTVRPDTSGRPAERTVDVEPVPLSTHRTWAGDYGMLRLPVRADLDYLRRLDQTMSYAYLAPEQTLYVRYTEIRTAATVLTEVRERVSQPDVHRVVLDLRQNPGGDNHNNPVVVNALAELEAARPDVPIVVITDRVTFSAAANLTTDIEQRTRAVFVGEPMGGGLNFWDDVRFLDLDGLPVPMTVGVSTRYWQRAPAGDPRLTIEPDVLVPVTAADYWGGRDPALDAALQVNSPAAA